VVKRKISKAFKPLGRFFIKVGFMPNVLTPLSLVFALICSFAFYLGDYLVAGLLIIAVGFEESNFLKSLIKTLRRRIPFETHI